MIQFEVCVTVTLLFETIDKTSVRKIFFLRPGAVGDLLVATAALQEICQNFPQAQVCVAGPAIWTQLLHPELWPQVTHIFALKKNALRGEIFFPNKLLPNESALSFPHSLWKTHDQQGSMPLREWLCEFDVFINLRLESIRYAVAARQVRYRFGTCPWPMQFFYSHWSPWLGRDPILHERDRLLEVLEAPPRSMFKIKSVKSAKADLRRRQTGDHTSKPNPYLVTHLDQDSNSLVGRWRARGLPKLLPDSVGAGPRSNILLINPTSSRWEKAWHKEKFRELALRLKDRFKDIEVAIIGAPNETDWLKFIAGNEFRIIQPANFWQLQTHLREAKALIANCSSMQFFANATQTPTCTLFGRTFPARWGPLGPHDMVICGKMPSEPVKDIFLEDFLAYESLRPDIVEEQLAPWIDNLTSLV